MSHVGSRLSALVDGQLAPEEAERILAHVAGCPQCAAELAAARDAHAALSRSADVQPEPELTQRLLALGTGPTEPRQCIPVGAASMPMPGSHPTGQLPGEPTTRRRRGALFVGALGVVFLTGLFTLGNEPDVVVADRPSELLATLASAADSDLGQTLSPDEVEHWFAAHPWAAPVNVPDDHTVVAIRGDHDRIEVDMLGPDGLVVLTQERGVLSDSGEGIDIDGFQVHLVARSPWCVAWQSGNAVVTVAAEGPRWAAGPLVAANPTHAYDGGASAQVGRGWQVLMTTWSPP